MTFRIEKEVTASIAAALLCAFGIACSGDDSSKGPSSESDPDNEPGDIGSNNGPDDGIQPSNPAAGSGSAKPGATGQAGSAAIDKPADPSKPDPKPTEPPPADGPPGCGMEAAAFCDSFDKPSPGGRAGDLDDAEWSIGRISGISNPGQGDLEWWQAARSDACGEWRENLGPGTDFFICDEGPAKGRAVNAYNDGGGFTVQSMRVRKPFDFKDRTGVISFDVDGRSMIYLGHGIWWNFMLTEDPEPVPYQDGGALALFSRKGFGIEFQGNFMCDDYDSGKNKISQIFFEDNYEIVSKVTPDNDCFATGIGVMNHVEIRVSETTLEVFISDAGKPETLRKLVSINEQSAPNMFPLGFSKGYIHLQHSHYNADKTERMPAYASYQFDNVAFDGPAHPTPRAYMVPDSGTTSRDGKNVGYELDAAGIKHVLAGVEMSGAKSAVLTMNTVSFTSEDTLGYRFNGGDWHDVEFFFPGDQGGGARTFALPIEMGDLVDGDNMFEMRGTESWPGIVAAQIELTVEAE